MNHRSLTSRLGVEALLLQAPMAGAQDARLALAVCAAGGIGSLPGAMLTPEALAQQLRLLATGTDRPWNVNFFCHTPPTPDPARETAWRQALAPYYAEAGLAPDTTAPADRSGSSRSGAGMARPRPRWHG
jgi:nitronate monooxygenase